MASQRAWLFAHARAIVVPSVVEGFGLVPLEAAAAGLPCLFADQSSLGEVVSGSLASLVPWNPSESAARVMPLLSDAVARREHVERLRRDADRWRWERLAGELIATYEQSLRMPYRAAAVRAWQELEREQYLVEIDHARLQVQQMHQDLLGHLGGRMALARDDGFLTAYEQRGLLRLGSRPPRSYVDSCCGRSRWQGIYRRADRTGGGNPLIRSNVVCAPSRSFKMASNDASRAVLGLRLCGARFLRRCRTAVGVGARWIDGLRPHRPLERVAEGEVARPVFGRARADVSPAGRVRPRTHLFDLEAGFLDPRAHRAYVGREPVRLVADPWLDRCRT